MVEGKSVSNVKCAEEEVNSDLWVNKSKSPHSCFKYEYPISTKASLSNFKERAGNYLKETVPTALRFKETPI